mgnify:CR=1 FL=1
MRKHCVIKMVNVADIRVINSRNREAKKYAEIRESVKTLGLKTPIVVAPRRNEDGKLYYDLACGEGRLNIYKTQGMEKIPARVIDADDADLYIMSLVENFARKQYNKTALPAEIQRLLEEGYSIMEISRKLGIPQSYASEIIKLIRKNEHQLLKAVMNGRLSIGTAVLISECSGDEEIQRAISDAYEKKEIKAGALKYISAILKNRSDGTLMRKPVGNQQKGRAFVEECKRKIQEGARYLHKADIYQKNLDYIKGAFSKILKDECFVNLMHSQGMHNIPKTLAETGYGSK